MVLLSKTGYDTSGVVDLGSFYLVEGDILIEKSSLSKTKSRQAINSSSQLVSSTKVVDMTVRIDNSMPTDGGNLDWRNEIVQALFDYNGMLGSNVHFTLVTTSFADINIVVGNTDPGGWGILPYYVIAAAGLPSGGNPFYQIVVNSGYTYTPVSSGQKRYNIVHELGHCIGLRHTNWYGMGEGSAIGIGSSPNTGSNPDPSSVFNGGTASYSWSGFSSWDEYAVGYLYPEPSINGRLINYTPTGAVYLGIGGEFRWIRNTETLGSLFNAPWSFWETSTTYPSPIGPEIRGADYQAGAFLARDESNDKVYFVEKKKVDEMDPYSSFYNYARHILSMPAFNRYRFDWSKVQDYSSITFSSTPSANAWILGPILYK